MIKHLRRLFAYDAWANREVLANLRSISSNQPADALRLMNHVVGAEALWLDRLQSRPSGPVWPEFDLEQCAAKAREMDSAWKKYLAALAPETLDSSISYVNTKGESYANRVEDILLHVLFHSHYHRGQVARAVRAAGFTPAYTDYIHAVRQTLVE